MCAYFPLHCKYYGIYRKYIISIRRTINSYNWNNKRLKRKETSQEYKSWDERLQAVCAASWLGKLVKSRVKSFMSTLVWYSWLVSSYIIDPYFILN